MNTLLNLSSYRLKRLFIIVGTSLLLFTALAEIWIANIVSTSGEELVKLANIKERLLLDNQLLEMQIASQSSLQTIEQKARQKGFQPLKTVPIQIRGQNGMVHISDLIIAAVLSLILWLAIILIFKDRPINLISLSWLPK